MTGYQIPRNSLAWLLLAQVAVIAPHVTRLPFWVIVVCAGCIAWRVMVFTGRWRYPGRWTKVLFVLGGVLGVPLGYRTLLGLEPAVALLIVAYVLKLLEMHHKRDAFIVVMLGYFVAMTQFLFFQTIPWTLYIFAALLLTTAGMIGLNQTTSHTRPWLTMKTSGVILMQALPLMIVLFLLFPRLPPLWTVPLPSQTARSGVSDRMSPGDVAQLAASSDLAFKATFEGDMPPLSQLYWRGLVLSNFDGRTWYQDQEKAFKTIWRYRMPTPGWLSRMERIGRPYHYRVILEPTQRNWLFSLMLPDLPQNRDLVMARDYRLVHVEPIRTKVRYEVTSYLDYRTDAALSTDEHRQYTHIIENGSNPLSRTFAENMRASAANDREFIDEVLRMYFEQEFVYTLRPDVLGQDSIDEFLFISKRGFCEHFAGSFTFLMRAAGIPARVVVGYQGGEYNQFGDYVSVYQYDAHAWTEVWLEGEGWRRIDPTTAVAPSRVEQGLEAAVEEEQSFLEDYPLSAFTRQMLWLADLRLQLSALGYLWDTWVVGYTPEIQNNLISRYLGDVDRKTLGMIMLALFFSLLAIIGALMLSKRPHRALPPLDRAYIRYCAMLARQGLAREPGEGPGDYAVRVIAARPDLEGPVRHVTRHYVDLTYGAASDPDKGLAEFKRAVRAFRIKTLA